ncbi:glycoside hydrolase family 3 protein [Oscillatoria sp. FACHB-1407]|uniref:glycoside hydrolase family 3 protein n=1 Tax=Oscillatoria sp. FACHB-1407 TaxID=2692847 RepID=UPI001683C868|nr:glycoside hydrolase family 3 protein [Oscillatoria sp. FACHB-1407]MBD2459960.1 glycoside hydrolase family 3 protein [Oscillatoria sp. FACHB-1407]
MRVLTIVTPILTLVFRGLFAIACLVLSIQLRHPFMANVRSGLFGLMLIVAVGLVAFEIWQLKKKLFLSKIISFFIVGITSVAIAVLLGSEIKFNLLKQTVMTANPSTLETLGQHFVVGYRDFDEIQTLVSKRAIGGVFITRRNIENKTKAEIQQDLATLQAMRRDQNLPPLWIATDQEGGIVSRLSPPLTQLPPLSSVITNTVSLEQQKNEVLRYASTQAQELSELGVNLNFAPVVDLNKGIVNPNDRYSQIYQRAISSEASVVQQVALWYCQTLEKYGVNCTLKHFPGLGGVFNDTHIEAAELNTSVNELAQADWLPFQSIIRQSNAFLMLGHVKLMAIDSQVPVSFSQPVITNIIRQDWQHDGVLITDDFCMQAVYGSQAGIENATVQALNASVDLVLISFDPDIYYTAMDSVLRAYSSNGLNVKVLEESDRRLKQKSILLKTSSTQLPYD